VKSTERKGNLTIVMEPRNIPHNSSISGDRDTYRSARVIGGREFGVVRRELWDNWDLYGRYFQKD